MQDFKFCYGGGIDEFYIEKLARDILQVVCEAVVA